MVQHAAGLVATRGRFITFEGGEGAGKSTQVKHLSRRLEAAGLSAVVTREPGGSPGAEIIRHLILSGIGNLLGGAEAETLLFAAARDDHVETLIRPALARGQWVLCDRFSDSTRVYQGRVGAVSAGMLNAIERVTIGDLKPDLTFILDVPVEIGMSRAAARRGIAAADRFEAETVDFHRKLREAYRQIAAEEPQRCVMIDAVQGPNAIAEQVWATVSQRLLPQPVAQAEIA
jgi:dTMP kinase